MKRIYLFSVFVFFHYCSILSAQYDTQFEGTKVLIETTMGEITILLYSETPLHRDNFLKLIREGYYDNQIFHRVIKNFMIQGGDPNSKNAKKGLMLGTGGPGYSLPAEFNPKFYHKKGALAAARKSDSVNPERSSSGSQFYIVQGTLFTVSQLNSMIKQGIHSVFTAQQIRDYTSIGGSPHLDGAYTVFGEIVKGFDTLDKIADVAVDEYDRPLQDIHYTMKIID